MCPADYTRSQDASKEPSTKTSTHDASSLHHDDPSNFSIVNSRLQAQKEEEKICSVAKDSSGFIDHSDTVDMRQSIIVMSRDK